MVLTKEERYELFNTWYGREPMNEEVWYHLRSLGLLEETWRPVKDWEEKYEVSNRGRVRIRSNGYIMSPHTINTGYLQIKLTHNKRSKQCLVHRLVAEAFLDNDSGLPEVNHIDEDKTNNNLWNLEWCTRKYNHDYNDVQKLKRNRKHAHKVPVAQYTKEGRLVAEYKSLTDASKATGITLGMIARASNGERKTTGGYVWKRV
jgi:hypothetical protein